MTCRSRPPPAPCPLPSPLSPPPPPTHPPATPRPRAPLAPRRRAQTARSAAAMPSDTGIDICQRAFRKRTFEVGSAERHAVPCAAGLRTEGYKPFCAIYSTFLQRGYDQIVHDVAIQKLPVRFAIDRAGLVGADGATHAGSFDNAYLGCLPNFVIMAASHEATLGQMVATQVAINDRPNASRHPPGEGRGVEMPEAGIPMEIGKGRILNPATKIALLSS